MGFLRAQEDDSVRLVSAEGQETKILRSNISEFRPSPQSLMPTDLLATLTTNQINDLVTFLQYEAPSRGRMDSKRWLPSPSLNSATALDTNLLRIVLVASKQDHGPGQHDYPRWQSKWAKLLAKLGHVELSTAWEWPSTNQWRTADLIVFYFWNHDWSTERYAQLDAYQARGGGVTLIHAAVIADSEPELLAQRIGLAAQPARSKYRHCPFDLNLQTNSPITLRLPETLRFLDEPYWPMIGDPKRVQVLGTARIDGQTCPLVWQFEKGLGRVFGSVLGHYFWTLDDPAWRLLCLRGMAWAAKRDVESLSSLAIEELDSSKE